MRRLPAILLAWFATALCAAPAQARGTQPAPAVVHDLAWGEVLFEHYQERRLPALVRLAVAEARGELPHHGGEAELLRGGLYLAWGLRDEAAEVFQRLLASGAPPARRDQAWYWLARIHQERGEPARALAALDGIGTQLPASMAADRVDLQGRVLLALGRYEDAARWLGAARQPGAWQPFAEFNRAVALSRAGRAGEAEKLLESLGRMRGAEGELAVLRDRANLALGLARLEAGDDAGARSALDRVRLESPFAARALLAAGWAEAGRERYRAALGPWSRLTERPDPDGASLEALLAVPWAWHQLDEHGESVRGYRHAASACEAELARLGEARRLADGEALLRVALAEEPVTADALLGTYLHALSADHPFRAVSSDLRELQELRDNLLEWRRSLVALRDMVDTRRTRFENIAPRAATRLEHDGLAEFGARVEEAGARVAAWRASGAPEALATPAEQRLMARLDGLAARIAALPEGEERESLALRQRRLSGALHWQLNHEWPTRMYGAERSLHSANAALAAARMGRDRLAAALHGGPGGFEGYEQRIDAAAGRVDELLARVERDHARRFTELRALVQAELDEREHRVAAYLGQARFALAAAYDQATQPRAALEPAPAPTSAATPGGGP